LALPARRSTLITSDEADRFLILPSTSLATVFGFVLEPNQHQNGGLVDGGLWRRCSKHWGKGGWQKKKIELKTSHLNSNSTLNERVFRKRIIGMSKVLIVDPSKMEWILRAIGKKAMPWLKPIS